MMLESFFLTINEWREGAATLAALGCFLWGMVRKLIENQAWQGAGLWFRKGAGALIAVLGIYFIGNPFWGN